METASAEARADRTRYYDGLSAAAHAATLRWRDEALSIDRVDGGEGGGRELAVWPLARLSIGEIDPDGRVALSCKGQPGRVSMDAAALPPRIAARIATPRTRRRQYLGWTLVGVVSLGLAFALVVRLPAVAATLVPRSVENHLGEMVETVVVNQHRVCVNADGQRALEQLEARLAGAAGIAQPIRLVVIDSKTVNAVTLPGARMVIMRGLLQEVDSADQLAGVMAHETGHIARRDPVVALIRGAGISLVSTTLGINLGIADVSSLAGQLVNLSYSRDMERLADANGVAYLQASGLRSDGLAGFFALTSRKHGNAGSTVEFLSDHPRIADREKRSQGSPLGESALTPKQWAAVRGMCGKP
ncbi:M48 family metallopeptidase [Paraburkholderia sp. D15]|uniref:M48 family metallopeptidase n=1 Tax=Paraburkholderia sp. D15 TaxID=2880218 RepID=UPI002479F36F|nr:M48 family metallopeptidase [Paraburkholderia sp. D15]WGS54287.1 M48 family metallopeptidase [Paraburkholderia sp. D15]